MNIRRLRSDDLAALLQLYQHLHPDDPILDPKAAATRAHWQHILQDPSQLYFGIESQTGLATTCLLTLVPNLTRSLQPYGLIENVVTEPASRGQGFGTAILQHALQTAWEAGCNKVMLLTGKQDEATLNFYRKAGFKSGLKTGFIAFPTNNDDDG